MGAVNGGPCGMVAATRSRAGPGSCLGQARTEGCLRSRRR
jgi:hypothetical protein